jgi:chemosensory pili system protein ChpA (sensor histidine kinase/response regulator)
MDNNSVSFHHLRPLEPTIAEITTQFRQFAVRNAEPEGYLAFARSFRQIEGALEMVGEKAGACFAARLRQLCEDLGEQRLTATERLLAVARHASQALKTWFEGVAGGARDGIQPLLEDFVRLSEALGRKPDLRDLFFPDLRVRPPMPPKPTVLSETLKRAFYYHRAENHRKALAELAENREKGLEALSHGLSTVGRVQTDPDQWVYWWIGKAVADAALHGGIEFSPRLGEVLERLGQRLEQAAAEQTVADENLLRDSLFLLARSRPVTQDIEEVQRLYALNDGFALDRKEILPAAGTHQAALHEAMAAMESAKAAWLEFGQGNAHWYNRFSASLSQLKFRTPGDEGFKNLAQWLIDYALDLHLAEKACDDGLNLEMASALLVLEHSLMHGNPAATLGNDQFETLRRRLETILHSPAPEVRPDAAGDAPRVEFDAHEREMFHAVSREILSNLREAERELERFFRDSGQRAGLPALGPVLMQAEGAMTLLGFAKPAQLTAASRLLVGNFADAGGIPPQADTDLLAENLSSLIFFFQELQSGSPGDQDWLDALLERSSSLRLDPADSLGFPESLPVSTPPVPDSEAAMAAARQPVVEPEPLIGRDREAAAFSSGAIEQPSPAIQPDEPETEPARPAAAESGAPVIEPELLEVYLSEAGEILSLLPDQLEACQAESENRDVLVGIGRAFHTLKGSGRMVGLADLGEAAWIVERTLNRWLESRPSATPELLDFLRCALAALRAWVFRLAESGRVDVDYSELQARALALEADRDPAADVVRKSPAAAETADSASEPPMAVYAVNIGSGEPGAKARSANVPPPAEPDNPILDIFVEEALELFPPLGDALRSWRGHPQELGHARSMLRVLHTLKGSARLVGALQLGECVHRMESDIAAATTHVLEPTPDWFDRLEEHLDAVLEEFDSFALAAPGGSGATDRNGPDAAPADGTPGQNGAIPAPAIPSVRVQAGQLHHFALQSGEASIARIRMDTELRQLRQALKQLNETTGIMRDQLQELTIQAEQQLQSRLVETASREERFDPLEFDRYTRLQELTRMLAESTHDILLIQQDLYKNLARAEAVALSQARVTRDLQDRLTQIRLIPFARVADRFHRLVRHETRHLGKRAELKIHGDQIDLDVGFLDRIVPPLEHLLRNAVAHGLESPERRGALGKSEAGTIELRLTQEPAGLILRVGDDGAGIDFARVRAKAEALGLGTFDGPEPSREQLTRFLFASGFSTSERVSDIAGRGVGLDVVLNEVQVLGGRIELETRPGQGTTFALHIPIKQTMVRVLPVRAGGQLYALSTGMVERVGKFDAVELEDAARTGTIGWAGKEYRFYEMPRLAGDANARPLPAARFWVVFLNSGERRIAVVVDELLHTQEVVLKDPGPQVARLKGIQGATVLAGGQLVLLLDPVELAYKEDIRVAALPASRPRAAAVPVLMVVDDSITVRTVAQRFLTRQGFQVATAKDGIDALEQMQRTIPDLLLVDIEMPRMDGFDLTENVRNTPMLSHIPVIMISSRTADKHRQRALDIGVNAFLGKPYRDSELLGEIDRLLHPSAERAAAPQ